MGRREEEEEEEEAVAAPPPGRLLLETMAMVVASSSRIPNGLQRQSVLVAGSKVRPIWSVNVPTVKRTTHNSKTANASTLATESGRKNAFSTTFGDGSEFASRATTTTTTNRRRSTTGRRRQNKISTPRAEKRNDDGSIEDDDSSNSSFLSMELLLQTVIVVFTLGFIDAGYVFLLCGCLNVFAFFDLCAYLIDQFARRTL